MFTAILVFDACSESKPAAVKQLRLMNSEATFPETCVGQESRVKIEFKNSLENTVDVEVVTLRPPFSCRHHAFTISLVSFSSRRRV